MHSVTRVHHCWNAAKPKRCVIAKIGCLDKNETKDSKIYQIYQKLTWPGDRSLCYKQDFLQSSMIYHIFFPQIQHEIW